MSEIEDRKKDGLEPYQVVFIALSDAGSVRETQVVAGDADLRAEARAWLSGLTDSGRFVEVTVETVTGELLAVIEL